MLLSSRANDFFMLNLKNKFSVWEELQSYAIPLLRCHQNLRKLREVLDTRILAFIYSYQRLNKIFIIKISRFNESDSRAFSPTSWRCLHDCWCDSRFVWRLWRWNALENLWKFSLRLVFVLTVILNLNFHLNNHSLLFLKCKFAKTRATSVWHVLRYAKMFC